MTQKFYAVRRGKTTGVFLTWDECKKAVHGVSGAEFKSFPTKDEAENFIKITDEVFDAKSDDTDAAAFAVPDALVAFVDGSYDVKTKKYAFGCVLIAPDGNVTEKSGSDNKKEAQSARNVAGELLGTMTATNFAVENGYKKLRIYHDYTGISRWYRGEWKAESFVALNYLEFMEKYRSQIEITFVKVEAHTGVSFNERADILAKTALGLV